MSERLLDIDNYTLRVSVCPLCQQEALTSGEAYPSPDVAVPSGMEWSSCWSCGKTGIHLAGQPLIDESAYIKVATSSMIDWTTAKERFPTWFYYLLPNLAYGSKNREDLNYMAHHSMLMRNFLKFRSITAQDHARPGWSEHAEVFQEVRRGVRRLQRVGGEFTVPKHYQYISLVESPLTCKTFGAPWIIPLKMWKTPGACDPRSMGSPFGRPFVRCSPCAPHGKKLHMAFPLQSWPGRENGFLNLRGRYERHGQVFDRGRFSCVILTDTEGQYQDLLSFSQQLYVYLHVPKIPTNEIMEFDSLLEALDSPELKQSWLTLRPPPYLIRAKAFVGTYTGPMPHQVEEPELPPTR